MIIVKLRNMSIRQKLTAIIMFASAVILFLGISVFIIWGQIDARQQLVCDLNTHAGIIGDNCKAALAFADEEDAELTLSAVKAKKSIVFASIYDKQDRIFAQYQRIDIPEKIQPPQPKKDCHYFEDGGLSVFKKIELDGEIVGIVYLQDDMSDIHSKLMRDSIVAGITLLIVLAIAYFLSSNLQKVVSKPILSLAKVATSVSEKKDYSLRASHLSNDEIGHLVWAFNKMLEKIQKRDSALVEAKEDLETRVRERTAELTATNEQLRQEITERRNAEEALRKERDKAQKYLDVAGVMFVVVTADQRLSLINKKGCQILGYQEDEIVGKNWFDIFIPEKDREKTKAVFNKLLAGEVKLTEYYENPILTKSGEERVISWHNTVLKDEQGKIIATLGSGADITERKQLHEILDRKQKNLEAIFDAAPVGMMLVDNKGSVKRVNDVLAKLVNRDFSEIINKRPGEGMGCIHVSEHANECGHSPFCSACLVRNTFKGVLGSWQAIRGVEVQAAFLIDKKEVNPWLEISAEPAYIDGSRHVVLAIQDITKRKQAEEKLQESEEQYRGIFEAMTDGLRIGTMDGKAVEVNQAFAQMHGYSPEELAALSPKHWIDSDSHNLFEQFIETVKAGKTFKCEGRDVHKDGSVFDVEVHGIPWNYQGKLHTLTIVRDITERKQLHETLDRKQKNLEAIFDAAPLGMMLVDDQGFVKRVNDVLAKLVHRDFSEIINRQPGEGLACIHASGQADGCGNGPFCSKCPIRDIFEGVLSSWQATRGVEIQAALLIDGKEVNPWLEISAEPAYIDGNRHVVLAIQDITKRKHTEQALREAMAQSRMANTAKSQFLATMSHEIRTPMNAIIGFTNLLAESELTDEQKEHLNLVKDSGHNLLRLIDDILDLSKIEAQKVDVDIAECSLGQLLNSVESLMMPKAKIEGLNLKIIEEGRLPAQIHTDVTRVRQCLINLVSNAIKFTREGHIYLRVSLQEIENTPFIRFEVEDTGIGIPQDKQDEIFKTFVQADNSTSREFGGTGLGLAISKRLAELLGGQLTISSKVGKGSVFSLTIPADVDVTKQPFLDRQNIPGQIEVDNDDEAKQVEFTGNILVAEDARTNQVLIKSLLKRLGLKVTIVEDGNQAVQKALSKQFDLIFMDIEMPNMNGYEATKAIRKEGLKTPIIALTAYAMKGDDEKCFAAGCNEYISKPIEHKKLLQALTKYLSEGSEDISRRIDSAKSDVEQFNQLCSETASSETAQAKPVDEQYGELPVDFEIIKKIYDDEEVLKETVKIFLEEAPQTIELLAEAIEAKDSKNVKIYAHKLKGLARHVAARKISDMLLDLETKGRKEELEGSEALFADIQTEFDKLKSFLSQPNWTESAEQQIGQTKIAKKT